MYKVLLIDDEKIIRIALKSMINWENQGFTVCGTASNCDSALQLISDHTPHLLIVDIMMPKTDGLTFIKQARSRGFDGQIVILSNHQNFDYAVEAMRNNVFDYMLKTDISPESLISVLKKVKIHLDKTVKTTLPEEKDDLNNDFVLFQKLLDGSDFPENILNFSDSYLLLDIFLKNKVMRKKCKTNVPKDTLKNIIQEIPGVSNYLIVPGSEDSILLLVPEKYWLQFASSLNELVVKIENLIKLYMNTDCGFVCSTTFHTPKEFSSKLNALPNMERLVFYYGFHQVIEEIQSNSFDREINNSSAIIHKLKPFLSSAKFEECKEILRSEFYHLKESKISIPSAHRIIAQIYEFIIFDNSIYLERSKDELKNIASKYQHCCTLEEYVLLLYELIDLISLNQMSFSNSSFNEELKIIDAFIQENLDKKITLAMLAKHVNRSENYLSRLFKSETGINTITYINTQKMHHAKELLANSQLSIKEIASALGFDEQSYFNRIFNKIYGLNPSEYRKKLS